MTYKASHDILATKSRELEGKKIILCVTGSVAAVHSPEVARELMRHGATVNSVMSRDAQKIIHPNTMEWATGRPVVTEITGKLENIELAGNHQEKAHVVLIAPATDNTIGKIAHGVNDTPVTSMISTALGSNIPILVSPAMHGVMYDSPVMQENMRKLEKLGIGIIYPRRIERKAKIAETQDIVEAVIFTLQSKSMSGMKILITAGPTYEHIDPIRVITNPSSGRMGVELAREACGRGAVVSLVYGPGSAIPPNGCEIITVESTQEMYDAVVNRLKTDKFDVCIASSAASDFRPAHTIKTKIPSKERPNRHLELESTPKIIDAIKKVSPQTFLVAFKAEYKVTDDELIQRAVSRLNESKADLVVANDVGRKGVGFAHETNEVFIVDGNKNVEHVKLSNKNVVARKILDSALMHLKR